MAVKATVFFSIALMSSINNYMFVYIDERSAFLVFSNCQTFNYPQLNFSRPIPRPPVYGAGPKGHAPH